MKPDRWQQIERLYHDALEMAPERRIAFLEQACEGDEDLRQEIVSLLASYDQAGGVMDRPPDDVVAGMLVDEQARSIVGRTLGRYKILSLIGAGGMGEVYRARDLRLDREVAVKILPEPLAQDPEALRRFEREARAVAALSHPNILSIFDFGTEEGVSYAVMELLEGESLRERLRRGVFEWRRAAEIGVSIAEGLAAAHAKGIIHRDLKPENLFLTAEGQVKILDFGIARVKRPVSADAETLLSAVETTHPGTVIGTIGYMSPEQVRGEETDAPSDLFSLGTVLHEMVSGERPFARATMAEMIAAILDADPPPLFKAGQPGKTLSAPFERVVRHCLSKGAGERYQSARDLASDLNAVLNGTPLTAAGAGRAGRAALWLGLMAVVLLGAGAWRLYRNWQGQAIDSLAVLPLVNASGDAELEYLSDGITDAVTNRLSQLPQLKRIIAQSTMATYKGKQVDPRKVGQDLNVRAVLAWRMTRQEDALGLSVELVDVADGTRLWGGQYAPDRAKLFVLQGELAQQISTKLRLALTREQQERLTRHYTENAEAYRLYLQGYYYSNKLTPDGLRKGLALLNQAVDADPTNALAYAGLANAYAAASDQIMPPAEAMPRVRAAAQRALALDETLGEAHTWLAYAKSRYELDWTEGEKEYRRALALNPSYAPTHQWYGWYLAEQGRMKEAIAEITQARDLDPLTAWINTNLAWFYYLSRQPDEAIPQLQAILRTDPNFIVARYTLGAAYEQKGMMAEALGELHQARQIDAKCCLPHLGYINAVAGRRSEAQRALDELLKNPDLNPYDVAIIYAGLREKDLAFEWLEKAYAYKSESLLFLKVEPWLDGLRTDPRYAGLVRKLKMTP